MKPEYEKAMRPHTPSPLEVWAMADEDGTPIRTKEEAMAYVGRCWQDTEEALKPMDGCFVVRSETQGITAICFAGPSALTNARLYSKAPDLLKLLRDIMETDRYTGEHRDRATEIHRYIRSVEKHVGEDNG